MTIDDFSKQCDALLDADVKLVKLPTPPTEDDIQKFEARIMRTLAPEYREFLKKYGPIYVVAKEEVWPRPKPFSIGPRWTFSFGLMVLGIPSDAHQKQLPDWMNIESVCQKFHEKYPNDVVKNLLPFFKREGIAEYVCFGPENALVLWNHQTPDTTTTLDQTFFACILHEIHELMKDKEAMKERLAQK